ncbi:MAG TPA: MgtC/SapB family protein, partial [Caulobacteraceae bacterium]
MPLVPTWSDIAVRLALTMIAGAILGLDRGARGHAAGLRTTILVALAAAVAMVQANILLPIGGKTAASFSVLDLMRLPLGILTGVGFIGGGAILKRGDIVRGVTTAATLWIATVIGLCFGGGQVRLGLVATVLAFVTLFVLDYFDRRIPRQHRARLIIEATKGARLNEMPEAVAAKRFRAHFLQQTAATNPGRVHLGYEIVWRRTEVAGAPADLIELVN